MAFQYYQNNTAGWGSNQFQFGPPPAYGFQPQQHWRAYDFYSAHAPHPQTEIFQYAMNRLSSGAGPLGVGMHEARHWHRRAYGGIGDITRMLPSEIGHAAGYEAYRSWIHRSPTFQILDGDLERQKEALISLAIAEAAHLWEATGRGYDQYALQTVSETAAATASLIFSQTVDLQMLGNDYYRARNATYPNAGDAYAMDDMVLMQRQQMGGGAMGPGAGSGGAGMMGGPGGMMGTGTLGGLPRPASAGPIPTSGIRGSPYMGASPMVGGSPYAASASPYVVGGGAAPAAGVGGFVQPGAGAGMVPGQAGMASGVQYGSSIASTYPGIENARPTTYGASGYGSNVVPGPPGGTFGGGVLGRGGYGAGAGGYGAGAGGYGAGAGGYGAGAGGYGAGAGTYGAGGYGAGGYGAGGYGAGSYGAGGYGGGYGAGGYGVQPQQPVVMVERRRSRHGHHHRRHHSVPRTGYY